MNSLLLALPLIIAAPIPKEHRKVAPSLEGTWEFVTATFVGRADSSYDGARWQLGKDGKATRYLRGDEGTPATYKADTTGKSRDFDWTINGNNFPGIYELNGDTLTVALSLDDQRPTDFKDLNGRTAYVFTMKKSK